MFDIDFFKKINDKYGHSISDVVLSRIGDILLENLRKLDIACRIGGEEFGIICRHTNLDESKITAEKLRCMLEKTTIDLDKEHISITASFGIITFPDVSIVLNSSDEVYHQADIAMYYSKEHGRNCVYHIKDIDSKQLDLIIT